MAVTEVEEAIVAHLVRQPGVRSAGRPSPSGWVSHTGGHGGPGADPDSIAFQKTRQLPTCQMHQVAFINFRGIPMELVIRTWQERDGTWIVAPVGGGSPGGSRRQRPWVNFTAGFGASGFAAGGNVEGLGAEQAKHVRMTFADGFVLADSVDSGIVLFFEPRTMAFPAEVEILDAEGSVLAVYRAFDELVS
jgi:hypothetical protein